MPESNNSIKTVAIVGGGLVGALNACFFAKRDWSVELFEARDDLRKNANALGRSINLALSTRGIEALRAVDLEDLVLQEGIPMYGRYIHDKNGKSWNVQKYGMYGEHIFSISRKRLNEVLLDHLKQFPAVKVYFEHKLKRYSRKNKELIFQRQNDDDCSEIRVTADLICGCDGSYSALRTAFLNVPDFNYSQTYIEHKYLELRMDPDGSNEYKMPPNYFHIWPRGNFCLIGLPNVDKTFNITLMAPFSLYNSTLNDDEHRIDQFFAENFPDARDIIGREHILEVFRTKKPSHLVSVKCSPHHMDNCIVLLGDAAHAMVPFYGQGMNCGFEDCLILHEVFEKNSDNIALSLKEYSKIRCIDSHAICDLALYNYSELRDLVNHWSFRLRKFVDFILNKLFPTTWIPLYNMVTFSRIRYHEIVKQRSWQDKIVERVEKSTLLLILFVAAAFFIFFLSIH